MRSCHILLVSKTNPQLLIQKCLSSRSARTLDYAVFVYMLLKSTYHPEQQFFASFYFCGRMQFIFLFFHFRLTFTLHPSTNVNSKVKLQFVNRVITKLFDLIKLSVYYKITQNNHNHHISTNEASTHIQCTSTCCNLRTKFTSKIVYYFIFSVEMFAL